MGIVIIVIPLFSLICIFLTRLEGSLKLATYVRKLKDRSGNYVVPATRSTGVYLSNNQTLQKWIDNMEDKKFDLLTVYPVGAIFQSTSGTSPASLFGGDWEQITERFLVGAGGSYAVNSMGGEANHVLSANELPPHNHRHYDGSYTFSNSPNGLYGSMTLVAPHDSQEPIVCFKSGPLGRPQEAATSGNHSYTENTGSGWAHNNMPPYYAVNIWRRTA